ncbi:MAG: response regulator [Candidatus Aureabacteria bacterium]|nr:response regulator [Candidatus Auribacterota bacterium]
MWKILLVDDNFSGRKLVMKTLEGKAKCDIATNGNEALQAYELSLKENKPYDVILLDIEMPEVDGLEVLKRIRQKEEESGVKRGQEIPIIMLTVHREPFSDAFKKGCDDYIVQPIRPDFLIERIEKHVKNRQDSESRENG